MTEEKTTLKKVLLSLVILATLGLVGVLGWFIYDQKYATETSTTTTVRQTTTTAAPVIPETFSVVFDSPLENATISATTLVKVTVGGEEDIEKVEFYVNGEMVSSDTEYAFTYELDPGELKAGDNQLKAVAYDVKGQKAEKEIKVNK